MIPYALLTHALQNFRADISMVALFVQTTLVIDNEGSRPQKSCNKVTRNIQSLRREQQTFIMLTKVSQLLHCNAKTPQLSVTADEDKKRPSVKSQRKNTHVQAVGWWKTTLEARFRQETSTLNEHIGRKDIPKCETHGRLTCHRHFAIFVPCGPRPAESTEPADRRGVMPNGFREMWVVGNVRP